MGIEIVYSKFKAKENADPAQIKNLMVRDSSWGTFVENLYAAEKSCKRGARERWKKTEPKLTNLSTGGFEDELFSLTFPKENFNFENEGIDHFISTIAGDILLNPSIEQIEVENFNFKDPKLYKYFPGPNVGISKLYGDVLSGTLGGFERPVLAFTVKPRLGLNIKDYQSLFYQSAEAGIDIVEDDERLIDPPNCAFRKRVDAMAKIQKSYKTVYSVNITGTLENAIQRLDYAAKRGIKMVKFDVLVTGFETLRRLALYIKEKYNSKIGITVYPDAYRAYRNLSRKFILKMSRLCGADIIYAGSPNWARYEKIGGPLKYSIEPIHTTHRLLRERIEGASHIKESLPTITNDQHPSRTEIIVAFFRKYYDNHFKYAFFVGGGISGFPDTLTNAVKEWLGCIKHAMRCDLSNYEEYDFDKYEDNFERIGWERLDVKKALQR